MRKDANGKRRAEILSDPNDRAHGTPWGYRLGCRCDRCVKAYTDERIEYRQKRKERDAALLKRIRGEEQTVHPIPADEPPKPNPVREAKSKAAAESRAKRIRKDICTVDALHLPMMGRPSVKAEHCLVCGRTWPLEQHHVVFRSAGEWVRNGREVEKPTITLCGFGNNAKDADGRWYCHGKAHAHRLHFRWQHGAEPGTGWWEYLETDGPTDYQTALGMDGWKRIGGKR